MADTDIKLSVDLDVKDAEKTAQQLHKEINDIFASRNGQQSPQLMSLQRQMKSNVLQAQKLQDEIKRLRDIKLAGDEFDRIGDKMRSLQEEADSFQAALSQMTELSHKSGTPLANMRLDLGGELYSYDDLKATLAEINGEYEALEKKQNVLGKVHPEILDASAMQKVEQQLSTTEVKLDSVNDKLKQQIVHHRDIIRKTQETSQKTQESAQKTSKVTKEMEKLKVATDRVRKSSKNVGSDFTKGFGKAAVAVKKFALKVGLLLIGVRSLRALFMKMRTAIIEAFKNLESSEIGKLKQQMEDLNNASTTMKNALVAAFEPIVTAIIPYIQRLVEWLTIAIDKMAQFIAAVSGQKTYIKAIKQVGNAAEKAGNQAKQALGPLDNLNVLTSPTESGGAGAGNMFEEAEIPDSIFDKLEKLKEMFKLIADEFDRLVATPFMEGFTSVLPDAQERLQRIWENLKGISNTIMEIANSPEVQKASEDFVQSFWRNQGAWVGLGAKIGLILGENVTGGVNQFLQQHKNEIQTDIVKNLGITTESLDTATALAEALGKIIEPLSEQDAIDTTSAALGTLYEILSGIGTVVNELVLDVSKLMASPIIENADSLRESLSVLLQILSPLAQGVESVAGTIKRTVISVYEEGVSPIIQEITRVITEFTGLISEWWNNGLGPFLQGIADDLKQIFEEYLSPILEDLGGIVVELLVPLKDAIGELWDEYLRPLVEWFIQEAWPEIEPVLQALWDMIKGLVKMILADIDTVLFTVKYMLKILNDLYHGDFTQLITDIFDFGKGFEERAKKWVDGLLDVIKGFVELLENRAISFFDNIKNRITRFVTNLEESWNKVKELMDTFAKIIGGGFEDAWNDVKNTIDNIISGIKASVGTFVDWINEAISNITSGFGSAKDWISNLGKSSISYGSGYGGHTRSGAASGAVIPPYMSEHLIKVGDNNVETEIISPLSTMKEALIEALATSGVGGNGNQQIILNLDGREFMRAMVKQNNEFKKQTGTSAFA